MSTLKQKTGGFVNLSYCVNIVKMDLDDFTDRLDEKATQLAIRAYSDLNIFNSKNVEVEYLDMDDEGIVDISELTDYVDYIKIGIPINGKVWVLNKNNNILKRRNELNDDQFNKIFKGTYKEPNISMKFAGHYVNGGYQDGLFGLGGGFSRSYFNIDLENMQIQFDSAVPQSQIILEYISTGINANGATLIPRFTVEYIVAYMHWKLKEHNLAIDRFTKSAYKQQFLEEEIRLRSFQYRFKMEDYVKSTYSTIKQLKR